MRLVLLTALACCSSLVGGCGDPTPVLQISSGGSSASTGSVGISGGGVGVGSEAPTLFYGTVLERGERRYTYLVVAPRVAEAEQLEIEHSGSTEMVHGSVRSDHVLTLPGASLRAEFTATHDPAQDTLSAPTLTLNGTRRDVEDGWLFLCDYSAPSPRLRPFAAPMPDLPEDLEELPIFTEAFVSDLTAKYDVIATALGR